MTKMTVTTFKNRLATLCLKKGGRGLPRKPGDQHIIFKSIALTLDASAVYTETDINLALTTWLDSVGQMIEIDHVTLRRYLVDAGRPHIKVKPHETGSSHPSMRLIPWPSSRRPAGSKRKGSGRIWRNETMSNDPLRPHAHDPNPEPPNLRVVELSAWVNGSNSEGIWSRVNPMPVSLTLN